MDTGDHNAERYPCDRQASQLGGSSNIPSRFMLQKPELSVGLMSHLAHIQTLPFLSFFMHHHTTLSTSMILAVCRTCVTYMTLVNGLPLHECPSSSGLELWKGQIQGVGSRLLQTPLPPLRGKLVQR